MKNKIKKALFTLTTIAALVLTISNSTATATLPHSTSSFIASENDSISPCNDVSYGEESHKN